MISLSIGQNQMRHIQTTELYEHDKMNLQGFVWKQMFEYLSEKIGALATLRSKVPIWPVSVVVGKTTVSDSDLFVSCTHFWQLTRGSGDCAGEMAGNAAQDEVYILWSVHFWSYEESMVKLENEYGHWWVWPSVLLNLEDGLPTRLCVGVVKNSVTNGTFKPWVGYHHQNIGWINERSMGGVCVFERKFSRYPFTSNVRLRVAYYHFSDRCVCVKTTFLTFQESIIDITFPHSYGLVIPLKYRVIKPTNGLLKMCYI